MRASLYIAIALVGALAPAARAQGVSDVERAIRESTRIIESAQSTRNERLDAQAARGALFRKTGRFDLAIVDLTEVLRNRTRADDVYVSAGSLAANRQPDLALADLTRPSA